jgi:hypothetical protein
VEVLGIPRNTRNRPPRAIPRNGVETLIRPTMDKIDFDE